MEIHLGGPVENSATTNSSGCVQTALKLTKTTSTATSATRSMWIQRRMLILMGSNGFTVNIAESGFIRSVKFRMDTQTYSNCSMKTPTLPSSA